MRTQFDNSNARRWGGITIVLLAFLGLGVGRADDRVIFSKPTNSVDTPAGLLKERKLQQPMELIEPGRPSAPVVDTPPLPANIPSTIPNQALKDMLDRQRNWVFLTPETAFDTPQKPDIDPTEALSGQSKASKRVLEVYLDNQSSSAGPPHSLLDLRRDSLVANPKMIRNANLKTELSRAGGWDLALDQPIALGSLPSAIEKLRSLTTPSASALSPLVYPGTTSPTPPSDPDATTATRARKIPTPLDQNINLLPDLTTEAIQPTIGRNPAGNAGPIDRTINPFDGVANANRRERRIEDILTTQIMGPSTLAPAIASPLDNRLVAPAPTVLEIPKRKF